MGVRGKSQFPNNGSNAEINSTSLRASSCLTLAGVRGKSPQRNKNISSMMMSESSDSGRTKSRVYDPKMKRNISFTSNSAQSHYVTPRCKKRSLVSILRVHLGAVIMVALLMSRTAFSMNEVSESPSEPNRPLKLSEWSAEKVKEWVKTANFKMRGNRWATDVQNALNGKKGKDLIALTKEDLRRMNFKNKDNMLGKIQNLQQKCQRNIDRHERRIQAEKDRFQKMLDTITYGETYKRENPIAVEKLVYQKDLGTGNQAVEPVTLVRHPITKKTYAKKVLTDQKFDKHIHYWVENTDTKAECDIMRLMDSCFTVKLHAIYSKNKRQYLLMEPYDHNLHEYFYEINTYNETEGLIRALIADVMMGLVYIHNKNIVYGDMKMKNLVRDRYGARFCDFGLSQKIKVGETKKVPCGTAHYMAPEMFSGSYGKPVDWWGVGIILYEMRGLCTPWELMFQREGNHKEDITKKWIYDKIRRYRDGTRFDLPYISENDTDFTDYTEYSDELKDLLKHLIDTNSETRYGEIERVLQRFDEATVLWVDVAIPADEMPHYIKKYDKHGMFMCESGEWYRIHGKLDRRIKEHPWFEDFGRWDELDRMANANEIPPSCADLNEI